MKRRKFLQSGAMSLAAGLAAKSAWSSKGRKKVLVLGGTGFLGPATVQCLLDRGFEVTLFNRGQTNPELFSSVEKLRGDRTPKLQNLSALDNERRWFAVIDVWPQELGCPTSRRDVGCVLQAQ